MMLIPLSPVACHSHGSGNPFLTTCLLLCLPAIWIPDTQSSWAWSGMTPVGVWNDCVDEVLSYIKFILLIKGYIHLKKLTSITNKRQTLTKSIQENK